MGSSRRSSACGRGRNPPSLSTERPVVLPRLPIVDGHCHPLLRDPAGLSLEAFLDLFTEGRAGAMREHVRHTGYYRRTVRALAQRLGVAPTAEAVLEARRRVGADAARAHLDEAGVEALLV